MGAATVVTVARLSLETLAWVGQGNHAFVLKNFRASVKKNYTGENTAVLRVG